jgi:hypothetical protein
LSEGKGFGFKRTACLPSQFALLVSLFVCLHHIVWFKGKPAELSVGSGSISIG